jgi:hypothetical protein
MSRRFIVPVLALILLFSTHLPAAAAVDAPSRCGQIGSATPVGGWVSGTIDSATDVDWYRFALPEHANVQLLLGGLPANYRMDVYRQCGDTAGRHFRDYQPGTRFEELILSTSTAPFVPAYVRISGVSGASSAEPYQLRAKVVPAGGLSVLSSRTFVEAGERHIVGEVLTTGRHRNVRVTATLFDNADSVIATETVPAMVRHITYSRVDRRRTPFEVVFDAAPGFDHYRLTVHGAGTGTFPIRGLNFTQFDPFVNMAGGHFPGEVRNNSGSAIDSLDVFVTLYDALGRVINMAPATTGKEHVGAGGKSLFDATFSDRYQSWNRWRALPDAVPAP